MSAPKIVLPGGFWLERVPDLPSSPDGVISSGPIVTLGLTDAAQADLGELMFAELPPVGKRVSRGESLGIVESVKSVQELICPVDGMVVEINSSVVHTPELINESPLSEGWLLKIRLDAETQLDALHT